jgi:hypothetical protein
MVGSFNVHPETNVLFSPMSPGQRVLLPELGRDLELARHDPVEDEACRGRLVARECVE